MGSAILFVGFGCLLTLAPLQADFIKSESKRKRAPEFELTDFTAAAVRISDYKAKVVLLNFWATWCIPVQNRNPMVY